MGFRWLTPDGEVPEDAGEPPAVRLERTRAEQLALQPATPACQGGDTLKYFAAAGDVTQP